jgi:tetraacyldisaccharide 4'-kinase
MESMQTHINKAWHSRYSWVRLLWPISLVFRVLVFFRRLVLCTLYQGQKYSSPVVVVGNISVGGCGKTPLLIALAGQLIDRGLNIAIVSRGYGAVASSYPVQVNLDTLAADCGDEPLLIRQSLPLENCIVVVDPNRSRGVNYALEQFNCDLVLCDDGLQHYRLHRDVEIAVIDGDRGLGNKHCLPAGPLREPASRLKSVDFVVINGESGLGDDIAINASFNLKPKGFRNLSSGEIIDINRWAGGKTVHALAAIGNPKRFADTLELLGFEVILQSYDDHETMTRTDLMLEDDYPVIITAKDAVKFSSIDLPHVWVLDVEADVTSGFIDNLLTAVGLNQYI